MVTEELRVYIEQQLKNGVSEDTIKETLKSQGGWNDADVAEAIQFVNKSRRPAQPAAASAPKPGVVSGTRVSPNNPSSGSAPTSGADTILANSPGMRPGGGSRNMIIIGAIIVGILLVGGAAFAYVTFFTPKSKSMTPLEIITQAFKQMPQSGTFSLTGTVEGNSVKVQTASSTSDSSASNDTAAGMFNPNKVSYTAKLSSDGSFAHRDGDVPGTDIKISNDISADVDFGFPLHFGVNFDMISLGDTYYLRLNDIGSIPFLDLSKIRGKWIMSAASTTQKLLNSQIVDNTVGGSNGADATAKPFSLDYVAIQKDVRAQTDEYVSSSEFQDILNRSITPLDDETTDGVSLHHYRLALSVSDAEALLLEGQKINDSIAEKHLEMSKEDIAATDLTKDELALVAEYASSVKADLWIGAEDTTVHRVVISAKPEPQEIEGNKVTGSATFELVLKDVNTDVTIKAPSDSITSDEVMSLIIPGLPAQRSLPESL